MEAVANVLMVERQHEPVQRSRNDIIISVLPCQGHEITFILFVPGEFFVGFEKRFPTAISSQQQLTEVRKV